MSAHIAGFAKWAGDEGYALYSRKRQVLLAACFSRWLGEERVSPGRVTSGHVVRYLRSRARHLNICRGDAAALRQFIDFLRRQGVTPAERIQAHQLSPVEQVVQEFERYLLNERALAPTTAAHYTSLVRGFLANPASMTSPRSPSARSSSAPTPQASAKSFATPSPSPSTRSPRSTSRCPSVRSTQRST